MACDPEDVVRDVRWHKLSAGTALLDYVVVTGSLDEDTFPYDASSTEAERASCTETDTASCNSGPDYGTLAGRRVRRRRPRLR